MASDRADAGGTLLNVKYIRRPPKPLSLLKVQHRVRTVHIDRHNHNRERERQAVRSLSISALFYRIGYDHTL